MRSRIVGTDVGFGLDNPAGGDDTTELALDEVSEEFLRDQSS